MGTNMPYIAVNITKTLSVVQRNAIAAGLGAKISLIPGKKESALMVDISEGHTLYMGGVCTEDTAYLDVKIYGITELEHQKAFTEAAFEVIAAATGIDKDAMYLCFSELPHWGTRGTMK